VTDSYPRSVADLLQWIAEDVRVNLRRAGPLGALAAMSLRLGQYGARGHGPLAAAFRWLSLLTTAFARLALNAELPRGLSCGRRLVLPHGGRGVVVHPDVELGDDVCLMHQVTIGAAYPRSGVPRVGNGVFVGVKASILGDLQVGDGALVAAHALVVRDVPAGMVAMGVPAQARVPAPATAGHPSAREAARADADSGRSPNADAPDCDTRRGLRGMQGRRGRRPSS
jgi:serine acetyltransferase